MFLINSCQRYFSCVPPYFWLKRLFVSRLRRELLALPCIFNLTLHSRHFQSLDTLLCIYKNPFASFACCKLLSASVMLAYSSFEIGGVPNIGLSSNRMLQHIHNIHTTILPKVGRESLIPKLRLLFCRVPWGFLTRSPYSTRAEHLFRFAVRFFIRYA